MSLSGIILQVQFHVSQFHASLGSRSPLYQVGENTAISSTVTKQAGSRLLDAGVVILELVRVMGRDLKWGLSDSSFNCSLDSRV
jgi:hypothetical protein